MKPIKKDSRILNITHKDLDGIGCSIVLGNSFDKNKIEYRSVKYNEIDQVLRATTFDNYDFVILTDISPSTHELLENEKIILLDHHDTALEYHNPEKRRAVIPGECGTILVKKFCESVLKVNLSYLNDLIFLINDYDMWNHTDPRSKQLNEMYYKYWDRKFMVRFFQGVVDFTAEEQKFLREREIFFNNLWENLEVYPLENINGAFIQSIDRINDLCDKLLTEEGYDFIFCRNQKSGMVAVRSKKSTNIHVGNILKDLGVGGGHANAAGISPIPIERCQKVISQIEEKINEAVSV